MKRISLLITALAVALCFGAPTAFGQGRGQAGRPSGMGGPGMGGPGMGGPGMTGPGMGSQGMGQGMGRAGMGNDMGRNGTMGNTRRNGTMGNRTMGSQSVSHSSPTSVLSTNPVLSKTLQDRLGSLLPAGTSLTDAASGFKNLGQFIAAVHVSHNLGIPFNDLKDKMTSGDNLGKAIKELQPDSNHKSEAKKAKKQEKADLKALKS